mgnify:CR=1 FL=1
MKTDTQIARETKLEKIRDVAARVGFPEDDVYNYAVILPRYRIA